MANTGVTRTTYVNVLLKDAREKGFLDLVGRRHNLLSAFQKTVPDKVIESMGGAPFKSQIPIRYRAPYGFKNMGAIGQTAGVAFSDATSPLATMSEWWMMVDSFRFMFDDIVIKAGNKWSIADHVTDVLSSGRQLFNCMVDTKLHGSASAKLSAVKNKSSQTLAVDNIYLFQGWKGAVVDAWDPASSPAQDGDSLTISEVDIGTGYLTVVGTLTNVDTNSYITFEDPITTVSTAACQYSIPDALGTADIALLDEDGTLDYGNIDRSGVLGDDWKGREHNFAARSFSFSEFDEALWKLYVNSADQAPDIAVMNEKVMNRVQAEHRRDMTKITPGRKALNEDISGMPYLWYGNELLLILDPKVPGARDVYTATTTDGEIWVLNTKTFELQQIGPPELAASRTMYPDQTYPVTYSDMFWIWNLVCKAPGRNMRCYGIKTTV